MIETIQAGLAAVSGGLEIARGLQALNNEVAVSQAVIEIQRSLLEAQRGMNEAEARHVADQRKLSELSAEIDRLTDWSHERERYELVVIRGGSVVFMLKEEHADGVDPHWLCASCFTNSRKSFLQNAGEKRTGSGEEQYACGTCGSTVTTQGRYRPRWKWTP